MREQLGQPNHEFVPQTGLDQPPQAPHFMGAEPLGGAVPPFGFSEANSTHAVGTEESGAYPSAADIRSGFKNNEDSTSVENLL